MDLLKESLHSGWLKGCPHSGWRKESLHSGLRKVFPLMVTLRAFLRWGWRMVFLLRVTHWACPPTVRPREYLHSG